MTTRMRDPEAQAARALEEVARYGRPTRFFLGFRPLGRGEHAISLSSDRSRLVRNRPHAELEIRPGQDVHALAEQLRAYSEALAAGPGGSA